MPVTCYICGRDFGTKSIGIHLPNCQKKWEKEQDGLPKGQRRDMPTPPPDFDKILSGEIKGKALQKINQQALEEYNDVALTPCQYCQRTFLPKSLKSHQKLCTEDKPMIKQEKTKTYTGQAKSKVNYPTVKAKTHTKKQTKKDGAPNGISQGAETSEKVKSLTMTRPPKAPANRLAAVKRQNRLTGSDHHNRLSGSDQLVGQRLEQVGLVVGDRGDLSQSTPDLRGELEAGEDNGQAHVDDPALLSIRQSPDGSTRESHDNSEDNVSQVSSSTKRSSYIEEVMEPNVRVSLGHNSLAKRDNFILTPQPDTADSTKNPVTKKDVIALIESATVLDDSYILAELYTNVQRFIRQANSQRLRTLLDNEVFDDLEVSQEAAAVLEEFIKLQAS